MKLCVLCFVLVLQIQDNLASTISKEILEEGHDIVERFAQSNIEFTSHEVADVLYENAPGYFHRVSKRELKSLTDKRDEQRIRLNVPSGSMLNLNLKKRSLFDMDSAFYTNTEKGQVKSESPVEDCYASGNVDVNGTFNGIAAVAFCNGFHGSATIKGMEYYFHPVGNTDGMHQVHVLKREAPDSTTDKVFHSNILNPESDAIKELKRGSVNRNTYKTATGFIIEMAVFVDAHYYAQVQTIAPGREDEYVLMAMAAAQAMYDDKDKVGYDVAIKIKLYVNWKVNPQGYLFLQNMGWNLREFCEATRTKYSYDMHFLYTGVTTEKGPAIGVAYPQGVCTTLRCACGRSLSNYRYVMTAHEIGHNLGFYHHAQSRCPDEVKSLGDGFMGHKNPFDFSSCNKWELNNSFSKGKGQCLFEETAKTLTSDKYINIPSLFPGQAVSPDQRCRTIAGEGYTYYRPFDIDGNGECLFFTCINLNKNSDEYLRVVRSKADIGYPCGDEMFCNKGNCHPWDKPNIGWDVDYLRNLKQDVSWSDWTQEWTECSNKCGTGVQSKQRTCKLKEDVFTNHYCRGPSVTARLCNKTSCPGKTMSISAFRQKRGDEICARFKKNKVLLPLKANSTYLPKSQQAQINDNAANYIKTKSCFLSCIRDPARFNDLDAIYPDGTPCTDTDRTSYSTKRFGIQLRCVVGVCTEFSDCPGNAKKDKCGVCGGDPAHCITKTITSNGNVVEGKRKLLAIIPAGSRSIDIEMVRDHNKGVTLELMNDQSQHIFGPDGLFKNHFYRDDNPVTFAGTKWTYSYTGYIRAVGPTNQKLLAQALTGKQPIKEIRVTYLEPEQK